MIYTIKNQFGYLEFINQEDTVTITIKDGGNSFVKYFEVELKELERVIELLTYESIKVNIDIDNKFKATK